MTAPSAQAGTAWEAVDSLIENEAGFENVVGMITTRSGFLAWGPDDDGTMILTMKANGTGSGDSHSFVGQSVISMVATADGVAGFSLDEDGGLHGWRLPDGGTWSRDEPVGLDGEPSSLATIDGGFVAAGRLGTGCDVGVWLSDDGHAWRRSTLLPGARDTCVTINDEGPFVVYPAVEQLLAGPGGLLALGTLPTIGNVVWTSVDGRAWVLHEGPEGWSIHRIVAGGPGYVAVGEGPGSGTDAAVWTSPDGATWTQVPDQEAFRMVWLADVAALDDGTLVAVGADPPANGGTGEFVAWTSPDGLTWTRSPESVCAGATTCPGGAAAAVATDGRRLLALGTGVNAWVSP